MGVWNTKVTIIIYVQSNWTRLWKCALHVGDFDLDAVHGVLLISGSIYARCPLHTGQETGCDAPLVFHLRAFVGGVRNEFSATLRRRLKRHFIPLAFLYERQQRPHVQKVHNNEPRLVCVHAEGGVGIAAQRIWIGTRGAAAAFRRADNGRCAHNEFRKQTLFVARTRCVKRNAAIYIYKYSYFLD